MNEATANAAKKIEQEATILPISTIKPLPWGKIRKKRCPVAYAELLESVKCNGVYQAVVVRPAADGNFEIVAGYGRLDE